MGQTKYVYSFGNGKADGRADMKSLLGGKGANLAEMTNIGLPVPAGFTLTTEVCTYYDAHNKTYPPELKAEVAEAMKKTEQAMGAKFGDAKNPLLVSCRSGARVSMPGMLTRAPERQETSKGFFGSPNLAPMTSSVLRMASATSSLTPGG